MLDTKSICVIVQKLSCSSDVNGNHPGPGTYKYKRLQTGCFCEGRIDIEVTQYNDGSVWVRVPPEQLNGPLAQ